MATILYVPVEIGNSFATYELATAYNGITNLAALINKYAEVKIISDVAGNKAGCNCAPSLDGYKWNTFTLPVDVWYVIMNDIATNINAAVGSGVPATSLQIAAAYVAPWFLNISFWKTASWDAATAGAFYAARNPGISARFVPSGTMGGNVSLRGNVGFYGNSVVDGANIVTIGGLDALDGVSLTVKISGVDGSGNYVSAGSATAAIASGIFSASISATVTPGNKYYVGITNATFFAVDAFGGNVFNSINIGYGKDYTGVNADMQIDQWGVIGA